MKGEKTNHSLKPTLPTTDEAYFTYSELLQNPQGLDKSCLEEYLFPKEFEEVFRMPKDIFSMLPNWKKLELKKEVGLVQK